jgi:hypothetical protein
VRQFDAAVTAAGRGVAPATMAVRLADQRLDHTTGRLRRGGGGLDAVERDRAAPAAPGRRGEGSRAPVRPRPRPGHCRLRVSIQPPPWRKQGITRRADDAGGSTARLAASDELVTTVAGAVTGVVRGGP